MNYAVHYERLIARGRHRTLAGYSERHHITPRCMGGGDEPANLVDLTAEEHCVAHQLLVKLYPDNLKLAHAAAMMAVTRGNKFYGWIKRRHAAARRKMMAGVRIPDEQRARMLSALRAVLCGRKVPPETRRKISAGNLGRKKSPAHVVNWMAARAGYRPSEATRQKHAAVMLRRWRDGDFVVGPLSPSTKEKISVALTGLKRGRMSTEHREKLSAAMRGKPWTPARHAAQIKRTAI